ncbi:integrase catalytic domain-containing protein [Trichonephila clavipes]|uniref:Integrase catalytic domain-containing protein n=1 Tax=Trichonephila clavipes TaxID=2585209 RepID=A0A8X6RK47_TRICX|nr:integrase catalytic domain-containing protein [Trichonephila clavipes]
MAYEYDVEDFKFPIILPANDVVVELIREKHVKAMHAGSSILRACLQEKFWIIRAKRLVKQVLSECVICKRYKSKHVEVPFAPLPRDIVTHRQRGRISVFHSDNGTNFVGTNNALRTLDWDKIVVYSTAQKITWKFIPLTAAWWERIVRILKELLRRVLGKSIVNYEELLTIVCDCESIINARPLTHIHEDPNELLPLSPAMFIHGNSNCETPDLDQVDRSSLVYPGKEGVPRVARIRTSHGETIRPFQRLYPLEVSAKTEIGVLKASRKDSLLVEKTLELSTDHVSDSPTDYVP